MSGEQPISLELSKDIGKLAERTAKLEEGFERFEKRIDAGFDTLDRREAERAKRDAEIADHIGKVCALAKLGIFFLKWVFPSGGLIGLLVLAKTMGWLA